MVRIIRGLLPSLAVAALFLTTAGHCSAQVVFLPPPHVYEAPPPAAYYPPAVSYYYSPPAVSYYAPASSYYAPPTVAYYAPPAVAYYAPPAVSYYVRPAAYTAETVTTRYGPLGLRRVVVAQYYAP